MDHQTEAGQVEKPACNLCGKISASNKRCGNCKKVSYCSKSCQLADWKEFGHREACKKKKSDAPLGTTSRIEKLSQPSYPKMQGSSTSKPVNLSSLTSPSSNEKEDRAAAIRRAPERFCAGCLEKKHKSSYSNNQWKQNPPGFSRCKACISSGQKLTWEEQDERARRILSRSTECPSCEKPLAVLAVCQTMDCPLQFCSPACKEQMLPNRCEALKAYEKTPDDFPLDLYDFFDVSQACEHEIVSAFNDCRQFEPNVTMLTLPSGEKCRYEEWSSKNTPQAHSKLQSPEMNYGCCGTKKQITRYYVDDKNVFNLFTIGYASTIKDGSVENTVLDQTSVDESDYQEYRKLDGHLFNLKSMEQAMTVLKPLLDQDGSFSFYKILSDPDFSVIVSDWVSFGDVKDTQAIEPQNSEVTGTITGHINTVRQFVPGSYVCTVIHPFEGKGDRPFVFFHHEAVCPGKLMRRLLLMTDWSPTMSPLGLSNCINRYDWCHWRNWPPCEAEGLDDYLSWLFFTPTEHSPLLGHAFLEGRTSKSAEIPGLFGVTLSDQDIPPSTAADAPVAVDEGRSLALSSLAVDTKVFVQEWCYGLVYQDPGSEKHFALCLQGHVGALYEGGAPAGEAEERQYPGAFASVKETNMRFPVGTFLREGATLQM